MNWSIYSSITVSKSSSYRLFLHISIGLFFRGRIIQRIIFRWLTIRLKLNGSKVGEQKWKMSTDRIKNVNIHIIIWHSVHQALKFSIQAYSSVLKSIICFALRVNDCLCQYVKSSRVEKVAIGTDKKKWAEISELKTNKITFAIIWKSIQSHFEMFEWLTTDTVILLNAFKFIIIVLFSLFFSFPILKYLGFSICIDLYSHQLNKKKIRKCQPLNEYIE